MTNSQVTFFCGSIHMDVPELADLQVLIYSSSVWTQDVIWKTYWERWIIGMDKESERESGKSALSAQLDNDDENNNKNICLVH